jgi:hypothetical protein
VVAGVVTAAVVVSVRCLAVVPGLVQPIVDVVDIILVDHPVAVDIGVGAVGRVGMLEADLDVMQVLAIDCAAVVGIDREERGISVLVGRTGQEGESDAKKEDGGGFAHVRLLVPGISHESPLVRAAFARSPVA